MFCSPGNSWRFYCEDESPWWHEDRGLCEHGVSPSRWGLMGNLFICTADEQLRSRRQLCDVIREFPVPQQQFWMKLGN